MLRKYICLTLVCACFLFSACSDIIPAKSGEAPVAPPQETRALVQAEPSTYPLETISPSPEPLLADKPAPKSTLTSLDEHEALTPALDASVYEQSEAADELVTGEYELTHEYLEEPEGHLDYDTNTFAHDSPDDSEGGYAQSDYIEFVHDIPAFFEVNHALASGMPFETLPESDRAAVMSAISARGYGENYNSISVTYKTDTLVSCLINIGSVTLPININIKTGETVELADFFTREDTSWRGLIPDIVMSAADRHGLTLLCDVPPVEDTHPCFMMGGNIVLLYRPYEITTYEAGSPCFTLPMRDIIQYTTGAYGIGSR